MDSRRAVRRLVETYAQARLELDHGVAECLVDPGTGLYNRRGLLRRAHELGAHATRGHEALACLVLIVEVNGASEDLTGLRLLKRCAREVRTSGRLSDAVGRLAADQLAVFAPATDAMGTVGMARRLADIIHSAAADLGLPDTAIRLRAGYDAVTNLGYMPTDPTTLLLRATRAVRGGRSEPTAGWIRRFDSAAGGATS